MLARRCCPLRVSVSSAVSLSDLLPSINQEEKKGTPKPLTNMDTLSLSQRSMLESAVVERIPPVSHSADPTSSINQAKNKGNSDQLSMLESAALFFPITLGRAGSLVYRYICTSCTGMGAVRLVADGGGGGGGGGTHSSKCRTALPRIKLSPLPSQPGMSTG